MSNKIKRLILYQAPRHQQCFKASVKNGFTASKINYSLSRDAPQARKNFGKIHNRHQITKLSYTLGNFQNNQKLISFASALTNLKSFYLTINIACLEQYNKVIKKLFFRKKRITEIKLILKGIQTKINFPWKALEMLRRLVSLNIAMQFSGLSMLQNYHSLLRNKAKRNIFPNLKSQQVLVSVSHPHLERPSLQSIFEVLVNIEAEAKRYSPCRFSFDFHILSSIDQSELKSLCSIFTHVQSLVNLTLDGRFLLEAEEENFMKSLEKVQSIEELSWLISPKETAQVFGFLPEVLKKLEACKKLRLWIRRESIDNSLDQFLMDLRGLSHLQGLSLSFTRSKGSISDGLITLADSLGKMMNLRDLTILCEKKGRDLIFDSASIEYLFEGLGKCAGLESLCLNFFDHFGKIKRPAFFKLCGSLQNLINLQTLCLDLSFEMINVDEEVIELWDKMLKSLSSLMDFSFNLVDLDFPFEAPMLSRFIESFGSLKKISALKLVLHYWEIEQEIFPILEKLLYNLKSLDSFALQLLTPNFKGVADDEANSLKNIQEKFSYKTFLQFEIELDL